MIKNSKNTLANVSTLACAVLSSGLYAQDALQIDIPKIYEEVFVTGGREAIRTMPGSASLVDEQAIASFDITDINTLLEQVPGIYIRAEDGYGLRPNIGIRGASSERSQKITLMEDGILISPAPYSAPAAYYVPNVNRMHAVEVFKGPSAVHYGPHTVGGAINMVSRPVPKEQENEINLSVGSDGYYKGRLFHGNSAEQTAYWIDVLSYGADGFKELDNGADTGFTRNDINAKFQWRSSAEATYKQVLEFKLGYADEDSDETYLGLTDEDFASAPQRRYLASQNDKFTSEHSQLHVIHKIELPSAWSFVTKAYVNIFSRSWNKFDGLMPPSLLPEENPYQNRLSAAEIFDSAEFLTTPLALLRGEINSDGSLEEMLDITNNSRDYGSHGIDILSEKTFAVGGWSHSLNIGLRFHHDYVERDHSVQAYAMQNGLLVHDGNSYPNKALNKAESDALAVYLSDEITIDKWKFNLGIRSETIDGRFDDKLNNQLESSSQNILTPGVGVFYQWTDHLGLLFGVNKGFSPNSPGASEDIEPEESINYEYGFRFQQDASSIDLIGFFSDYKNLLGRCRVSDPGCEVGDEFNGGNVEIAGLEFTASHVWNLKHGAQIPLNIVYTYTESAFQTGFESSYSQWGSVNPGDALPYLPETIWRIESGWEQVNWGVKVSANNVGEMREVPGQGAIPENELIESLTTYDIAIHYNFNANLTVQGVVENITDEQQIVSRKPFGARPNSPQMLKLNAIYKF